MPAVTLFELSREFASTVHQYFTLTVSGHDYWVFSSRQSLRTRALPPP
jgi:hypothetical protein